MAAHRDLGALAAPVLLVMLFTGWAVAVPEASKPLMRALAGGTEAPAAPKAAGSGEVDWPAVLQTSARRFPDGTPRLIVWPTAGKPALVRVRQAAEWHANGRTQLFFEPGDGRLLWVFDAQAAGRSDRLYNSFWPVHAGKSGGWIWRLVQFAGGLALCLLSLYGAEAYRRRLFAPERVRRRTRAGAAPRPAAAAVRAGPAH